MVEVPEECNGCCYRRTCNHDLEKCCYMIRRQDSTYQQSDFYNYKQNE